MTFTVLFDLDDTLLKNPMDQFMRPYLALLAAHLAPYISPEKMVPQLLRSTDLMIAKDQPCNSLELTFDADFYPRLGLNKEYLKPVISDFYESAYPTLRKITSPIPAAIDAVKYAFKLGCQVVIATNPLFPLRAIEHRLAWAGLPIDEYPFTLITSYETMHFAKPNPAYFAEIIGLLGWPEQPVCVIGNSLTEDILPARLMGLPAYFIHNGSTDAVNGSDPNIEIGGHEGIISWLDRIESEKQYPHSSSLEAISAILKTTPAVLSNLTNSTTEKVWTSKPTENEWSILEIICHMRDVEKEVNLPRINQFSDEDSPFIKGVDSDPWVQERNYNAHYTPDAFYQFCDARSILLDKIAHLELGDWEKRGNTQFLVQQL